MDTNQKQSIVEQIRNATNILVTVSNNPSVDALSAALGLTLILNKMDKHATAVVSGTIPSALNFLDTDKTFEGTVDSLRDFIIALDKEKADRLRYKVEGDLVRIFITPYRTTITEKDLQFSEGDFNVELVVALDVEKQGDLDKAIVAHGKILHDAAVVTINTRQLQRPFGTFDWSDDNASSICEMLVSLSEALQAGSMDEQISTALLTGIVSATDRFSNTRTTPRVMTMAAQLMAAGANQQLIVEKLQQDKQQEKTANSSNSLDEKKATKEKKTATKPNEKPQENEQAAEASADGQIDINHQETAAELATELAEDAEKTKSEDEPQTPTVDDLKKDLEAATNDLNEAASNSPKSSNWRDTTASEPLMGGTLNATTAEAEKTAKEEAKNPLNKTILAHDAAGEYEETPRTDTSNNSRVADPSRTNLIDRTRGKALKPVTMSNINTPKSPENKADSPDKQPTLPPLDTSSVSELEAQAKTVSSSVAETAENIDGVRADLSESLTAEPALPTDGQANQPPVAAPGLPPMPPMPDFSMLPPLPDTNQSPVAAPNPEKPADVAKKPDVPSPNQFKIPGQ